ncbi:DTW domain-containing protein 2-like [Chenopodium quinoa]|uniref:DTW domain-containing protein 2-like n=1 Tax=Chenopodium quinoa TaxID=63459 RepID=UPI000B78BB61|nr:DTW domain-containing protein 2-like [Chenopodium quinoa]
MEEEQLPFTATPTPTDAGETRRKICSGGCERPVNVCLCDKIPQNPISTNTQIVILQHPHEQRQRLATVPVLTKCLQNCEIIVGRKLREGSSKTLDSLYHGINDLAQFDPIRRAVFLFPGTDLMPSIEINEWRSSWNSVCTNGIVLIVFDGTWKHAKEMMFASLPFISKFATRVCFDCDFEVGGGTIYDSDLILKKEPFKGCMSTMEAVARALRVLEPSGVEIEANLVEVLKSMVSLQACYLKPVKPRQKC